MEKTLLAEIADRYLAGTATEQEIALLHEWYDATDWEEIELVFTQQHESEEDIRQRTLARLQSAIHGQASEIPLEPAIASRSIGRYTRWVAAAAVVVGLLFIGQHFWATNKSPKAACCTVQPVASKIDLPPGGNKAKLLLGDGSVVDLGSTQNGTIRSEAGTRIDKRDGQLIYDASKRQSEIFEGTARTSVMNTIQTPRGGQYKVILPDGTKVWINAASSLTYPTAFTGNDRRVELHGEAYFEVAEDKSKPFAVSVSGVQVDVLGTRFNIMAYDDEHAINTTLLEGAVKVTKGPAVQVLKEGQEASFDKMSESFAVRDAVADEAIAWKNGFFQFGGVPIETVMRQVARWYDVDVDYEGKIGEHFRGMVARSVNVSEVFKMLELTGAVHFRIEGKKIIVLP
jgi:transmembrane sensor